MLVKFLMNLVQTHQLGKRSPSVKPTENTEPSKPAKGAGLRQGKPQGFAMFAGPAFLVVSFLLPQASYHARFGNKSGETPASIGSWHCVDRPIDLFVEGVAVNVNQMQ